MKKLLLFISLFVSLAVNAQWELSTGYAANKYECDGMPIHIAYEFQMKNRWYSKSQLGFKSLYHFNDFTGATLRVRSWEYHQTFSYEIIRHPKYMLKPNVGFNYRFYKWKGRMKEPLNAYPVRAWVIGVRNDYYVLTSIRGEDYREYSVSNAGFSFQLQNRFRLSSKLWLHITPFIEPDYDASQNTGGCYVGIIWDKKQ
ncbi:MAG: hypothetical protein NTW29_12580 [Bacteroidetes bacterium]|nr:hypothetical protein [Bacteroidota bacterium]